MLFRSYLQGQTAGLGKGKIACKNRGQKRCNEASGKIKTQTEKFPSTPLKMDQKYEHLQYMADLKSVHKHAKNVMKYGKNDMQAY